MSLTIATFLGTVGVLIILAWAIYLVYRVGQIYLAPVFTMAIGAYFSVYMVRELGWPFGAALITAMVVGALATFLPALRLARVPPFTTAICTLALIFIAQTYIRNSDYLGGASGFFHIPEIGYLLPITYVILVIVGFFIYRVDHSRIGRAMETIFVDPDLAASLGVNVFKVRLWCQIASGALGAIAGVLYAFTIGAITPPAFGLSLLLALFVFLFVGGSSTMWGAVVFAPILWAVSIFIPEAIGKYKDVIYGSLLIMILILRPEGVIDKKVLRVIRTNWQAWLKRPQGRVKDAGI